MDERQKPLQEFKDVIYAYKQVFSTELGAKVLKDLEKRCYFNSSTFDENSLAMATKEGSRQVVLTIKTMMEMNPDQLKTEATNG